MKADLHIHTTESDGSLTVAQVLMAAAERGIKLISITDHETTLGYEIANRLPNIHDIEIIPGVELNTFYKNEEIHLLGYYEDINNDLLQERLLEIRTDRINITKFMVQKLNQLGIAIEWGEVLETASTEGVICQTHIIYAIRKKVRELQYIDWNDVASWFKPGGISYIPYEGNPYKEAIDFIYNTGGLPVLAHPGLIRNKRLIKDLLGYRPIGLEVYYGYWEDRDNLITYFEKLSEQKAILSTGGSDYHGDYSPVEIGQITIPNKSLEDLKHYLHIK